VKRLAILTVAIAIALALSPASWKWTHGARADDATVVVVVTAADGEQFVASTIEPQPTTEPYTADVVTADGATYTGATVDVLDAEQAAELGGNVTEHIVDSWSW